MVLRFAVLFSALCGVCVVSEPVNLHSVRQRLVASNLAHVFDAVGTTEAMLTSVTPHSPNSMSVLAFGADPTGVNDSTAAIQAAIDKAWTLSDGFNVEDDDYPQPDMGGLVVDFGGGHYRLSHPLRFPTYTANATTSSPGFTYAAGGNVMFANGVLFAGQGFPSNGFLIQVDAVNDATHRFLRYRYVTFNNMEFNAKKRASGGIKMVQAEQMRFERCRFLGFNQYGLWFDGVGNEYYASELWFQELEGYDHCKNVSAKSGTALGINNNDHSVSDTVILCAHNGVLVNNSANTLRNIHVYIEGQQDYPLGCVHATAHAHNLRVLESYMDGCALYSDDPDGLLVDDTYFLLAEGQPHGAVVVYLHAPNYVVQGLQLTGSAIGGRVEDPDGMPFFAFNTSTGGSLSTTTPPVSTLIDTTHYSTWLTPREGLRPAASRFRGTKSVSGSTTVAIDLSSILVFPMLTSFTYSVVFDSMDDAFVAHSAVRNATNPLAVTIVFEKPVSGTVSFIADQSTVPGVVDV